MGSIQGKSVAESYGDYFYIDNSNSGFDGTIRQIKDGTGDTCPLYLSNTKVKIQTSTDSTTNTVIYDASGNALVTVDSTNDLVKAGLGQHIVNTQFKQFGLMDYSPTAGTHHPLVSATMISTISSGLDYSGLVNGSNWGGTGTNPNTSLTIATVAGQFVPSAWLLQNNITIDEIQYIMSADASTTANLHVMSYSLVAGSGATAGDLTSGAVLAQTGSADDSLSPVTIGADRTSNGTLTINTADVDSSKAILVFAENVGGTDDITVQVNIKYHLR